MRIYRVPKHLLTRCRFGKKLFCQPVVDRRAHAERIIKWTTLMPSWIFILRVMKRGSRQFQKLQMKNTNWSFNILMIFHEFSLLNFLWSCRYFILFSIFKITHFLKLEIFSRSQFLKIENFWKNFPRRQGG